MEALTDYLGLLHGEAIAMGMCCAARLSVKRAGLNPSEADRVRALVAASGLPVRFAEQLEPARLLEAMRLDKKARAGKLRFVLLPRLGEAVLTDAVTEECLHVCR